MNALLAKLKAQAQAEQNAAVATTQARQKAEKLAPILPASPPKKISRGRPRKGYVAAHSAPNALVMVGAFADACLVENRDSCAYIGSHTANGRTVRLENGKLAKAVTEYALPNLRDAFKEFCRQQGYPHWPHKYFSGQLLHELTRRGWAVSLDRSYRLRRHVMRGVALNGIVFDGNDAYLL